MRRLSPKSRHPTACRRGFSFTEVMFAVVILGIGFIMIAAIFPVAIEQQRDSSEQASAATFGRTANSVMAQIASYNQGYYVPITQPNVANPTYVYPFDSVLNAGGTAYPHGSWPAVQGDLISPSDPRFAFIPLYSRSSGSNTLQLYIISVTVRNHSVYDGSGSSTSDVYPQPLATPVAYSAATLRPKLARVTINEDSVNRYLPDVIAFTTGTPVALPSDTFPIAPTPGGFYYTPYASQAVETGTYVIIANDNNPAGLLVNNPGLFNGKVYRVGNHRPDLNPSSGALDYWELIPGADLVPQTTTNGTVTQLFNADAWIVGKGLANPGNPNFNSATNPYTGSAQDIALYTSYLTTQ